MLQQVGNTAQSPAIDTNVFSLLASTIIAAFCFVLQANGVMTIGWGLSFFIYGVLTGLFAWAYWNWSGVRWARSLHHIIGGLIIGLFLFFSFLGVHKQYQKDHQSERDIEGSIIQWGPAEPTDFQIQVNPLVITGTPRSAILVNGSILSDFAGDYRIIMAANKNDDTKAILDRDLSKSVAQDIRDGQIPIAIPWNDEFIKLLVAGWKYTGYTLLLCPKTINSEMFSTMRQAFAFGCFKAKGVTGSP